MPNNCYYEMRIKGQPKRVDRLLELLQPNCAEPKRFHGICTIGEYDRAENTDGTVTADVCGDCAWSVMDCMIEPLTHDGTNLYEQTENLSLTVEVYGSEPGIGFQEHYIFEQGERTLEENESYAEYYFSDEADFNDTKAEYGLEHLRWTDVREQIETEGYYAEGGLGKWEWSI